MGEIVRAIREIELDECLDLWTAVWPDADRAYFARYFRGDHDFQPEYTRVCEVDGRIVSVAHIVKRTVSCGEFTLTLGGIANVATLPEFRRRGYSKLCLRQAVEVMEADAMDFSLLFTGTHALYEPLGWERVLTESFTGLLNRPVAPIRSQVVVRTYDERDDAAIHLIHQEFNRSRPITVRRTDAYWRDWVGLYRGSFRGRALVAGIEDSVAAYCLFSLDHRRTRVLELGWRQGTDAAVLPLLAQAAVESVENGITTFEVPIYGNPVVAKGVQALCTETTQRPRDGAMVRFLHRDNLLRGLAPALTFRWLETGRPGGRIDFAGPYGGVSISTAGGFLWIEEGETGPGALSQADLFQLLIGRGTPESLAGANRAFAEALFPLQEAWFWALDGF